MKVGILSGGGDAPGINAVIRAAVRKAIQEYGFETVGIRDGWRGLVEGEFIPL
ncbi:MAG: 6-phosphofructokinase, partial [Candidatus Bathyarchaeota archaeon]|nr:6-phosphofructokinase [Candidatus Bathyarchaeota archaeon]